MTKEEAREFIKREDCKGIYGFDRAEPLKTEYVPVEDKGQLKISSMNDLWFLKKENLEDLVDGFYWVWGLPGPDYTAYKFSEYGKTWAFDPMEIETVARFNPECVMCPGRGTWFDKCYKKSPVECRFFGPNAEEGERG